MAIVKLNLLQRIPVGIYALDSNMLDIRMTSHEFLK